MRMNVLGAKADALLRSSRIADAITAYRRVAWWHPTTGGLQSRAREAETKREAAVAECFNGQADAALQACRVAQLRGAADEWSVLVRKAMLLQSMDRPAQALDAYLAANVLEGKRPRCCASPRRADRKHRPQRCADVTSARQCSLAEPRPGSRSRKRAGSRLGNWHLHCRM